MSTEENKRVVRRFWEEVFNGGYLEAADVLFADRHEMVHPYLSGVERGAGPVKRFVAMSRKVSPDLTVRIEDEIAEGDRVVTRWSAKGTLAERLCDGGSGARGVAATGVAIFRLSGGAIEETWLRLEHDVPETEMPAPREEYRQWLLEEARGPNDSGDSGRSDLGLTPAPPTKGPGAPVRQPVILGDSDLRICCLWNWDCCAARDPGEVE